MSGVPGGRDGRSGSRSTYSIVARLSSCVWYLLDARQFICVLEAGFDQSKEPVTCLRRPRNPQ